ncbi:unnamed protein product [Lactuca virosa]|uniref:DUF659 domain-containing protein n=1 Tax=Lactuca virosa TaxID=75947 RepID=A0AAU9MHA1_9ASTR|nr:unnamed protein product [Lactuca virosa]
MPTPHYFWVFQQVSTITINPCIFFPHSLSIHAIFFPRSLYSFASIVQSFLIIPSSHSTDTMDTNNPIVDTKDAMDPSRRYGIADPTNRHKFTCKFCAKSTSIGVYRLKQHLVGGFKNCKRCPKCPEHVREEVKNYMIQKEAEKSARTTDHSNVVALDDYDEDDDDVGQGSSKPPPKKPRQKGHLDKFYANKPEDKLKGRKCGKHQTINELSYCNGICCTIWPGIQTSNHVCMSLEFLYLKNEVESTQKVLKDYKQEWAVKGCSILSDGWRDSTVQKNIVNFLVNSPKGSVFLKSLDVSEIKKDANTLFKMLDDMVEEIGEENVVQVVKDNASNYVKVGSMF